jgi:hypothetical protein
MDGANEDELFRRLRRLVASSKTAHRHDRRVILALENDLMVLRQALMSRSDALLQKIAIAGTGSKAVTAYSRVASLGCRTVTK